jgi:hypothetical protein
MRMRNRSSTGVLSSPAPHLAGELQSSLCMYSIHVCTKQVEATPHSAFFCCCCLLRSLQGIFYSPHQPPLWQGGFNPACCMQYVQKSFVPSSDLYHAPCTTYLVPHAPYPVPRTSHPVSRTSYLVLCTFLLSTLYIV